MRPSRFGSLVLGAVLLTLFAWLALDGRRYWHEVRFLYVATQFDLSETLAGEFNPHQVGAEPDPASAGGFYASKILHILVLKALFALAAPAEAGFLLATFVFFVAVVLALWLLLALFRELLGNERAAWWGVVGALAAPVTPYLAGKLLSEVGALLLTASALLAFALGLRSAGRRSLALTTASGVLLALTALTRIDMIVCFLGFLLAAAIVPPSGIGRSTLGKRAVLALSVAVVGYLGASGLLGIRLTALGSYLQTYLALDIKSTLMSLLGILTFGGPAYLFAALGIWAWTRHSRFFLAWLVVTLIPMIGISSAYMVEPRYLVAGLIPLAGLAGIGLADLGRRLVRTPRPVLAVALVLLLVAAHALVIPLMPYELDGTRLLRLGNEFFLRDPQAVILLPWSYTDYNFLRVMLPGRAVYNVNSPDSSGSPLSNEWRERFEAWYGSGFLEDPRRLDSLLAAHPVFYVGWRKYPPLENAARFSRSIGLGGLARALDDLPLTDHRTTSWLWDDPRYELEQLETRGQYEIYRVLPAADRRRGASGG